MSTKFVYRTFNARGDADSVRKKLATALLQKGFVRIGNINSTESFRYPSILFSSKKPLTCISRLTLEVTEGDRSSIVKIGFTFTKIRYFTITIFILLCVVIPITLGIVMSGNFDLPPMAFLGIPLGFMVHYHVRRRVFRTFGRLLASIGDN